jgi:hypothetical protein
MALAFGAIILNGTRTKVFTMTALDNDAAADLAIGFVANGMTVLPAAPDELSFCVTTSPDTANSRFAITANASTGITVRKLTAGGGANPITIRIKCHLTHTIEQ